MSSETATEAMPGLRVAYMYGRFLIGLRGYLRNTITLAQARDLVKERLTRRTESLLLMAERSVFGLRTRAVPRAASPGRM